MRHQLGLAFFLAAAFGGIVACSSSSGSSAQSEAGTTACSDTIVNVFNNDSPACPLDANGNPANYDEAITGTCDSLKLKSGDITYGQCLDYLVWEVDLDSSGTNLSKCFYDPTTHAFVGVVWGDGKPDQCGGTSSTVQAGTVDATCHIAGLTNGGGSFQSCAPITDGGSGESSLLGGGH